VSEEKTRGSSLQTKGRNPNKKKKKEKQGGGWPEEKIAGGLKSLYNNKMQKGKRGRGKKRKGRGDLSRSRGGKRKVLVGRK